MSQEESHESTPSEDGQYPSPSPSPIGTSEEIPLKEISLKEMLEAGVHKMGKKKVRFFEEHEKKKTIVKSKGKTRTVPVFEEKEVPSFTGPLQEMAKRMGLGKTRRIIEEEEMIEEGEEYEELMDLIEKERIEDEARRKELSRQRGLGQKKEKVDITPKKRKLVHIGEKLPPKARLEEEHRPQRRWGSAPARKKKTFQPSDMYGQQVPEKLRELLINLYAPNINIKKWSEYYEENFTQWRYAQHHPQILASLNLREFEERAKEQMHENFVKNISVNFYLDTLNNLFEDGNFAAHPSVEVYERLKMRKAPTAFEEYMMVNLEGVNQQGDVFASSIAKLIYEYIQALSARQPDIYDSYYKALIEKEIHARFEKLSVTEEEKAQFDAENLETLQKLYGDVSLSLDAIGRFEKEVYECCGENIYSYLEGGLRPYMYLKGVLSEYSKVFKAKFEKGKYKIEDLADSNLAIFFPELAMGIYKMKDTATIERALKSLLKSEIDSFLYLYRKYLYPGERIPMMPTHVLEDIKVVTKHIVVPQDACLRFKTILEMKDPFTQAVYLDLFGEESIENTDLAVCLLGDTFVCASLSEMREKFERGDFVDLLTGLRYPQSVIDRVLRK